MLITHKGKRVTRNLSRSMATKKAAVRARFRSIETSSEIGLSKETAARDAGLTINGLNSLLYRLLGTTQWPIQRGHKEGR